MIDVNLAEMGSSRSVVAVYTISFWIKVSSSRREVISLITLGRGTNQKYYEENKTVRYYPS